jgi:hypothetical protein
LALLAALLVFAGLVDADELPVRDPMRPFGGAGVSAGAARAVAGRPRFALTGVLIAPSRRVAFLNGKPYSQGAVVDGAEIVVIERDLVQLRERGTDIVISLRLREKAQLQLAGEAVP